MSGGKVDEWRKSVVLPIYEKGDVQRDKVDEPHNEDLGKS